MTQHPTLILRHHQTKCGSLCAVVDPNSQSLLPLREVIALTLSVYVCVVHARDRENCDVQNLPNCMCAYIGRNPRPALNWYGWHVHKTCVCVPQVVPTLIFLNIVFLMFDVDFSKRGSGNRVVTGYYYLRIEVYLKLRWWFGALAEWS